MVTNLPKGAEKAWFKDDDGIMRDPQTTEFGEPLTKLGDEPKKHELYEPEQEEVNPKKNKSKRQ